MKKRSSFNKVTMQLIALLCIFTIVLAPLAVLIMQNERMLDLKEHEMGLE